MGVLRRFAPLWSSSVELWADLRDCRLSSVIISEFRMIAYFELSLIHRITGVIGVKFSVES